MTDSRSSWNAESSTTTISPVLFRTWGHFDLFSKCRFIRCGSPNKHSRSHRNLKNNRLTGPIPQAALKLRWYVMVIANSYSLLTNHSNVAMFLSTTTICAIPQIFQRHGGRWYHVPRVGALTVQVPILVKKMHSKPQQRPKWCHIINLDE